MLKLQTPGEIHSKSLYTFLFKKMYITCFVSIFQKVFSTIWGCIEYISFGVAATSDFNIQKQSEYLWYCLKALFFFVYHAVINGYVLIRDQVNSLKRIIHWVQQFIIFNLGVPSYNNLLQHECSWFYSHPNNTNGTATEDFFFFFVLCFQSVEELQII